MKKVLDNLFYRYNINLKMENNLYFLQLNMI